VVLLLFFNFNKYFLMTRFSYPTMSSQQIVNCDTYTIKANTVTIISEDMPTTFGDINSDGVVTISRADPSITGINLQMVDGYINAKYVDASGGFFGGYCDCNTITSYTNLTFAGATPLVVTNTYAFAGDNNITVSGALTGQRFAGYFFRIQNMVFYSLRMLVSPTTTEPITATNASITTEVIFPLACTPRGFGTSETTALPAIALINGVAITLRALVNADGTITFTRPGGTFTLGETFYLLEMSGSFLTLV
jgi:hypothetical protein